MQTRQIDPATGADIDKFLTTYTPFDDLVSLYSKYVVPYVSTAQSMIQSTQSSAR